MGILQVLDSIILELLAEGRRQMDAYFRIEDPAIRVGNELKTLYGKGDISREKYLQLKGKCAKNQLGRGDLALIRRTRSAGQTSPQLDPEVEQALDQITRSQVELEDCQIQVEEAIQDLQVEIEHIHTRAEETGQMAQESFPDEAEARELLEIKHRLLERHENLQVRLKQMHRDLRRIGVLRSELDAYKTELKVLDSQIRLEDVEAGVREGLIRHQDQPSARGI